MKNFILSFLAIFLVSSNLFASFPVKRDSDKIEIIKNENSDASINAVSTAAAAASVSIGGFILGLLLGLIGVGLAYIFSDDEVFRRSSWYGLGTWVIILLLLGGLY